MARVFYIVEEVTESVSSGGGGEGCGGLIGLIIVAAIAYQIFLAIFPYLVMGGVFLVVYAIVYGITKGHGRAILGSGFAVFLTYSACFVDKPEALEGKAQVFYTQMRAYNEQYKDASNELQRTAAFEAARAYETQFFSEIGHSLSGWRGYLRSASTESVTLRLTKSSSVTPKITFIHSAPVAAGSNLFNQLAVINNGDCVVFSGKVDPKETSSYESAAMREPEYKLTLTEIAPCPKPETPERPEATEP